MSERPTNPGSYNDFMKEPGNAAKDYGVAVTTHRLELARFYGIDIEDLHAMRFSPSEPTGATESLSA